MSVCKHCGKPIDLFPDICQGRGQWLHRDETYTGELHDLDDVIAELEIDESDE